MINRNGQLLPDDSPLFLETNRAFRYGDGLFETIRTLGSRVYFWEDHYLRLMASMRILRMEIPMNFTMEFLESQIHTLLEAKGIPNNKACRVRLSVFRNDGGLYTPVSNEVSFVISAELLEHPFFVLDESPYKVELFREHTADLGLLANLKTNNRILNVVSSIYAKENELDNYILMNREKKLSEAAHGNIFLVNGQELLTPALSDGCINGIIRKKIIEICKKSPELSIEEASISPFELQKADEVFITNAVVGIRPVTEYRRKHYGNQTAKNLVGKLNALARIA